MLKLAYFMLVCQANGFKFINIGPGCGVSNPFVNIWTQASFEKKWYKRCLMLHGDFEFGGVELLGKGKVLIYCKYQ